MRAHRNDVYRARRSRGKAWPVILWILAGLIVLAVILFFAGQKYIVYDSDGSLHVVFPIMETAAALFLSQDVSVWQEIIDWLQKVGMIDAAFDPAEVMVDLLAE